MFANRTTRRSILWGTATACVAFFASTIPIQAQSLSTAPAPLTARDAARPTTLRNIVLVHGAWADASSWSGVIRRLQKAGYQVTAVQLGLASLDDDVARTRSVLASQTGPTLLVAHSYGGAVITQLGADAPNVAGLVYEIVSNVVPDHRERSDAPPCCAATVCQAHERHR